MSYTPYLIAPFATGLDKELQPWLLPDDALFELFDAYVYRGVLYKREGYRGFATGKLSTYTESRMVRHVTAEAYGAGNGTTGSYDYTAAHIPLRRGTITITAGVQVVTDNGLGGWGAGAMGGSINYTTGAMTITFAVVVAAAVPITVTYDYHPGNPVMGVMNFYTNTNTRELIVGDTQFINRYNPTTDRLDDITTTVYTGNKTNFWAWTNYPDIEDKPRLIFVNNADPLQQYNGTTITKYVVGIEKTAIPIPELYGTGTGITGPYTHTALSLPLVPFSVVITAAAQTVRDNGAGIFTGDGTGTVNYQTGAMSVTFNAAVPGATAINVTYSWYSKQVNTCQRIFQFKDRLILLATTEDTIKPRRIRISGFGQNSDVFTEDAPGAGLIDIPDDSWIFGAAFNRDDLLIFTENSTWMLKYTSDDVTPFALERIDESRGNKAPFLPWTYLNRTIGGSPRGLIVSDGYRVERMDDNIPQFAYNDVDGDNFNLCFSGFVDEDREIYIMYPTPGQDTGTQKSDEILVINFEEDNLTKYRIPMSCMGSYIISFNITWNDLTAANGFPNWDTLGLQYNNWGAFAYTKGAPIPIGGGHFGEIWEMNVADIEDNPLLVRNITNVTQYTCDVETDWNNYKVGDYISINATVGLVNVNDIQGFIDSIVVPNRTFKLVFPQPLSGAYVSGGLAVRVIPMEALTKKFNPFSDKDKKVRCGWMYFYVTTSDTDILNPFSTNDPKDPMPCLIDIDVITNDDEENTSPSASYKVDCTNTLVEIGTKKWHKMWINQTAKFVQFRIRNVQAGAKIQIHAMMPGFQAVGRLI